MGLRTAVFGPQRPRVAFGDLRSSKCPTRRRRGLLFFIEHAFDDCKVQFSSFEHRKQCFGIVDQQINLVISFFKELAYFVFKDKLSKKAFAGIFLMVVGTLLMVFFK